MKASMMCRRTLSLLALLLALSLFVACAIPGITTPEQTTPEATTPSASTPSTGGDAVVPYVDIGDGTPLFTAEEITTKAFEYYSPLDPLGRCGYVMACVGTETMPREDEERGSISSVRPSGWQSTKYDPEIVSGGYLYNRCHLIGWQLTAENANKQNLITGTRYLNIEGMLLFEDMVADYIKETGNHVMYRVTPVFEGENLVASGVYMEGYSVEDAGDGICFYVYCYNIQPGISINYLTGESTLSGETPPQVTPPQVTTPPVGEEIHSYVLNTSSMKFHDPDCASCATIAEANRQDYTGTREYLIAEGYSPCGSCKP